MDNGLSKLADSLFQAVKGYCASEFGRLFEAAISPLRKQLDEIPAGRDGAPGAAGKSAYEVWRELGNTGTPAEWLASLRGPAGTPGEAIRGDRGEPGAPGEKGERGEPGRDAAPEVIAAAVAAEIAAAIKALEPPRPDEAAIRAIVLTEVQRAAVNLVEAGRPDPEAVAECVVSALSKMPKPRDGVDGKSIDPADVRRMVNAEVGRAVAALPPAERGEPGKDADLDELKRLIAEETKAAVSALPRPADGRDGTSVSAQEVDAMVTAAVAKAMQALPLPKDGIDGAHGAKGDPGRDGKDGPPGRDAAQVEILHAIDPERSYPRATYAQHRGGVVRSVRTTEPLGDGDIEAAGWVVMIEGIAGITANGGADKRSFSIAIETTSGKAVMLPFAFPVAIHRGIWAPGTYEPGDVVTWDGSQWHCEAKTSERPGTAAWRLTVKRGRDGKDGLRGPKGDRGEQGLPGRDFNGSRV